MKIQASTLSIGNQIVNYVFLRFVQRQRPGEEWFLDNSVLCLHPNHSSLVNVCIRQVQYFGIYLVLRKAACINRRSLKRKIQM